jgi:hypothetical protein
MIEAEKLQKTEFSHRNLDASITETEIRVTISTGSSMR